jgi:hypothetical protein
VQQASKLSLKLDSRFENASFWQRQARKQSLVASEFECHARLGAVGMYVYLAVGGNLRSYPVHKVSTDDFAVGLSSEDCGCSLGEMLSDAVFAKRHVKTRARTAAVETALGDSVPAWIALARLLSGWLLTLLRVDP